MEEFYFLHDDCIQNFEIANYCTYVNILRSSKSLLKKIKYTSHISVGKHSYFQKGYIIEKLNFFPNLTHLRTYEQYFDLYDYLSSYVEKYHQTPPLKILKAIYVSKFLLVKNYTNLINLNILDTILPISILNYLSSLTCLKFTLQKNDTMQDYNHCSNIRVLSINSCHYGKENDWNYAKFVNLSKFSLIMIQNKEYSLSQIDCSSLTFLKLRHYIDGTNPINFERYKNNKMKIKLNNLTRLKYLDVYRIDVENKENYIKNVSLVKILPVSWENKEIEKYKKNM